MARFVRAYRDCERRDVLLLWLVNNDADLAVCASESAGLSRNEFRIRNADAAHVRAHLAAGDVGIALIQRLLLTTFVVIDELRRVLGRRASDLS